MQNKLLALANPSLVNHMRKSEYRPYPDDSDECVFLQRACDRLGAALHGDAWTGKERMTQLPELLPDALGPGIARALLMAEPDDYDKSSVQWFEPPSRAVLVRANELLARRQPERKSNSMGGLFGMMSPISFTYREWQAAQAEAQADYEVARAAMLRWVELQRFVKKQCEAGKLETLLRKVDGGDYSEVLPRSWWRTEDFAMRFLTFKMHPVHPFLTDAPAAEYQWIFVSAASLDRLVTQLNRKTSSSGGECSPYQSEYMQCMLATAAAMKISADNMPKKVEVEVEIPNQWRGPGMLSERDIKQMASFIRSAASRGGRNLR